jgi:hypothetical protein
MSNLFFQFRIPFRLRYASPSLHAELDTNIIYYNIISKNFFSFSILDVIWHKYRGLKITTVSYNDFLKNMTLYTLTYFILI